MRKLRFNQNIENKKKCLREKPNEFLFFHLFTFAIKIFVQKSKTTPDCSEEIRKRYESSQIHKSFFEELSDANFTSSIAYFKNNFLQDNKIF